MENAFHLIFSLYFLFLLVVSLQFHTTNGDARAETITTICATQLEHNATIFVPNFVATMQNISEQMRTTGFGTAVVGSGPDRNYGLAQCYGDLSLLDCVLCYAAARTVLPRCFPYSGGRIYLDGCFMRAENFTFFDEYRGPLDRVLCGNSTRKGPRFRESVRRALVDAVAAAPGNRGYARAEMPVSGTVNESSYVLADCWRTLNVSSCKACLENASSSLMRCLPWTEGRALYTGCFMRYSDRNFLNPKPSTGRSRVCDKWKWIWILSTSLKHAEIPPHCQAGSTIVMIVAIVSSVTVVAVGVAICVYVYKHKKIQKKRRGSNDVVKMAKTLHKSSLNFKYSILEKATGSFDNDNKLGQGGFGTVYKGVLADGREIAVKRLFFNNRHRAADFYNEVNIISTLEHKNLVRLLGCSCSGPESLLVYEFLHNKSLDRFIFDPNRGKALNWEKRFEIITGTAEGLVYLHENSNIRIIHRDIKASNILLDLKLRAKIADFGLARSFQEDKSHISTAIAGTLGYMAPEYLAHGHLTEKADVYSFGVLLLEIVTGRQNNRSKSSEYSDSIVTDAWRHFQMGTVEEMLDPNFLLPNVDHNSHVKEEIFRVVHVGLLCTQEVPSLRPIMSKALQMLLKKDEQLPAPTNPPFIDERTMELNDTCENSSQPLNGATCMSNASMSYSSFYPR